MATLERPAPVLVCHCHRVNDARSAGRRIHLAQHHSPYAIAPTGVWVDRMSACENTARSYLTDRFTQALAGEAMRPVDDPGRLAQALANWDIQTHRALARDLAPSNILLITRTQGLIAGASMVLVQVLESDKYALDRKAHMV